MFEIGNSLREARLRQGLDFNELEVATKIRGKYLRALEDEQFDQLPAQTYVKGFLRSYADYLGLDGQLYVDEYNSRYVVGEEDAPLRPRRSNARPRQRRLESRVVALALVGIAVVTALVIAAWKFGGSTDDQQIPLGTQTPKVAKTKPRRHVPLQASLVLTAIRGNCWVEVHKGSANGKLVAAATLQPGTQGLRFSSKRLWIRAGAPWRLRVRLNGKQVALPGGGKPGVFVVTRKGITRARSV